MALTNGSKRVAGLAALGALAAAAPAAAANPPIQPQQPGFQAQPFGVPPAGLTHPDDITRLAGRIYVTYQNDVQADGTPKPGTTGTTSTVVGYGPTGAVTGTWVLTGRCDGLHADPRHNRLIATVNEDSNTSLYTISPGSSDPAPRHYDYSPNPPQHGGGTDAVTIKDGQAYVSASNPSPDDPNAANPTFSKPALYKLTIPAKGSTAYLDPVFYDNSSATIGNAGPDQGTETKLNLSDPDSNNVVPESSPRFAGDIMLDSQGDSQLVFDRGTGEGDRKLTVLNLSDPTGAKPQVDDTEWARRSNGTLYVVDQQGDQIYKVTGPFPSGAAYASNPSGSAVPPQLGQVDLNTGVVSPFIVGFASPKGLLYVSPQDSNGGEGHGNRDQGGRDESRARR